MAFSTQHSCNNLTRLELRGSDTPLPVYFHGTAVLWSGPAVFPPHHATLNNAPSLSPNYPVRLKAYSNRRNVNVNDSFLDSCLRCCRNDSFTDTGYSIND